MKSANRLACVTCHTEVFSYYLRLHAFSYDSVTISVNHSLLCSLFFAGVPDSRIFPAPAEGARAQMRPRKPSRKGPSSTPLRRRTGPFPLIRSKPTSSDKHPCSPAGEALQPTCPRRHSRRGLPPTPLRRCTGPFSITHSVSIHSSNTRSSPAKDPQQSAIL